MIAVLAAMLFIGIVTASMLKNTKSQSAASIGYSTMHVMNSTVKSGMIATETFFANAGNEAVVKKLIFDNLNSGATDALRTPQLVSFGNTNARQPLGNGNNQFFSSEVVHVNETATRFSFEVKSGRTSGGKALKKAMAFYKNADGDSPFNITPTTPYNAKNAFYLAGGLNDGNVGGDFDGRVTIEGAVTFQNDGTRFRKDAYFNGGVAFKKTAKFEDKVYFNDYVTFQNAGSSTVFDSAVGLRGNIHAENFTVKFNSDLWFNGDFRKSDGNESHATAGNVVLQGNGSNNVFYSGNVQMSGSNMGCNKCPNATGTENNTPKCTQPAGCCPHNCNHPVTKSERIKDFANRDQTSAYKSNMDSAAILTGIGMNTLEERRDPELDIKFATNPAEGGTPYIYPITEIAPNSDPNNLTAEVLNKAYETASDAGNLTKDGYLVVRVNAGSVLRDSSGTKFKEKVIFLVDAGSHLQGEYFPTTSSSSTLIYVGGTGYLNQFGVNGTFHGLIYIDKNNTPAYGSSNHINLGIGDTIVGGIHSFTASALMWNKNCPDPCPSGSPLIKFNEEALNKFSRYSKGNGGAVGGWTVEWKEDIEPGDRRVRLKAMGYYFF